MTLLKVQDVPEYAREVAIATGYRRELSYRGCFGSLFKLHNETVNIWSHLLGFLAFFFFLCTAIISPPNHIKSHLDLLPIVVQLISYQTCMLTSTLFHTFSCHSEPVHKSFLQLDHFGILVALFGTYIAVVCDSFSCHPGWKLLHLLAILSVFGLVVLLQYSPVFTKDKYTMIKLRNFLVLGAYVAVPFGHLAWIRPNESVLLPQLKDLMAPYLFAGVGLIFYKSRFPERFFNSKTVDLVGASHQVWHVMIFLGMMSLYFNAISEKVGTPDAAQCLPSHQEGDIRLYQLSELLYSSAANVTNLVNLWKGSFLADPFSFSN